MASRLASGVHSTPRLRGIAHQLTIHVEMVLLPLLLFVVASLVLSVLFVLGIEILRNEPLQKLSPIFPLLHTHQLRSVRLEEDVDELIGLWLIQMLRLCFLVSFQYPIK